MCAVLIWHLWMRVFFFFFFFFNDTATTEIYTVRNTLSLHDALPNCDWTCALCASVMPWPGPGGARRGGGRESPCPWGRDRSGAPPRRRDARGRHRDARAAAPRASGRPA